jgi:cysteine desulfurase
MFSFLTKKLNKKRAYFDYASTTPLDPRVYKAMMPYLSGVFANPSSLYKEGVEARKSIENARKKTAAVLQAKTEEIVFTAGGTESNNMAILGTFYHHKNILKKERIHFVTTSIEHASVLEAFEHVRSLGAKITYIAPEENGIISVKKVEAALTKETVLISVMYANNEIGTIQPVREIGRMLKSRKAEQQDATNIVFHTDACQAAAYLPVLVNDLHVDLLTLDGSKIYGPKGSGILYRKGGGSEYGTPLEPILFGGGQEKGFRSGTENVAGIVGFGEAISIIQNERVEEVKHVKNLRDQLLGELLSKVKDLKVNGDRENRLPNNINICVPGLDAEYAVMRLDALGFAISSVTSCKTLSEDPSSYVIEELYQDDSCSRSSLRITMGRFTTIKEVNALAAALLTLLHS